MSEDKTQGLPNSDDNKLTQILDAVQNLSMRVESLSERMEALRDEMVRAFAI